MSFAIHFITEISCVTYTEYLSFEISTHIYFPSILLIGCILGKNGLK